MAAEPAPTEIRLQRAERVLEVSFADGARYVLPAEYLRVESPSAEVQGHGPGQKTLVAGRRAVGIMRVEPVGHYAVRIVFDDLHDSGIYELGLPAPPRPGTGRALGRLRGGARRARPVPRPAAFAGGAEASRRRRGTRSSTEPSPGGGVLSEA